MATKKTVKKIDAPIDQHETFVSLQKTFADSEMSVAEKLKTLYELQVEDFSRREMESSAREGNSPVSERVNQLTDTRVPQGT